MPFWGELISFRIEPGGILSSEGALEVCTGIEELKYWTPIIQPRHERNVRTAANINSVILWIYLIRYLG
jgi:hypothetical protein